MSELIDRLDAELPWGVRFSVIQDEPRIWRCDDETKQAASRLFLSFANVRAEVLRLEEERDSYTAQAEYEKRARITAQDFPRNRYGYIPCDRCGVDMGLDAIVDDEVWAQITPVPEVPEAGALCLWCMDEAAAERGIEARVRLYFRGKALLSVEPTDPVNDEMVKHAREVDSVADALLEALEAAIELIEHGNELAALQIMRGALPEAPHD